MARGDRASSSADQCNRLTGVYQRKGKWGVQIYANNKRIWLGTFKSKKEAALAYDRASIKLKGKDSPRNLFERESSFQSRFTGEQICEMIKDHSYDEKIQNKPHQICKVLTTSDVGSLNMLVIPKKHSNHLPKHKVDNGQATSLTFFDSYGKDWIFEFKHCTSSGSYVLTGKWIDFVKDKTLQAGDTVYFTPHSTRGNTFRITISRTSIEGLNSVTQEGRDHGALMGNQKGHKNQHLIDGLPDDQHLIDGLPDGWVIKKKRTMAAYNKSEYNFLFKNRKEGNI